VSVTGFVVVFIVVPLPWLYPSSPYSISQVATEPEEFHPMVAVDPLTDVTLHALGKGQGRVSLTLISSINIFVPKSLTPSMIICLFIPAEPTGKLKV